MTRRSMRLLILGAALVFAVVVLGTGSTLAYLVRFLLAVVS